MGFIKPTNITAWGGPYCVYVHAKVFVDVDVSVFVYMYM